MLSVTELSVRYGRSVRALDSVSIEVADDEVLTVLGGNGAGKSTLLRAISGTLRLHRGAIAGGTISLDGTRLDKLDAASIVRHGVVTVPEGRQVFSSLTVTENLRAGGLGAKSAADRAAARKRVLELFPILADRANQRAGLLSGGEQQMVAIGRALMCSPRVLLLDEPSLGLAPLMVQQIRDVIREIHAQGTSVVLIEQNAAMAMAIADMAVVLEVGQVATSGRAVDLAAADDLRDIYLGGHAQVAADRGNRERPDARAVRQLSRWSA